MLSGEDCLEPFDHQFESDRKTERGRQPVFLLASPFSSAPGTVRVLEPCAGADAQLVEQLCRGEFSGPFMLDTAGMRHLYFDLQSVQSSMQLEKPDALVTAYVRKMMAFLLFNRTPRHILLIGLGGGSLVKFCHRNLPDTRLTVVEIDSNIIALREWFRIPPDDDRLRVVHGDGAEFVRSGDWVGDVLLIDAFDHLGVAPELASSDFYAAAFRRLSSNGMLVMNLAGARDRYVTHVERLREACPGHVVLVPVMPDGNLLAFAFARPACASTLASLEATAEALQVEFALDFPKFLERLRTGHLL